MNWSSGLHPQLRPYFVALLQAMQRVEPSARVSSAYRSSSEQARLYRNFVAGRSRYPVAAPGTSRHEYGRAVDIVASPGLLAAAGAWWKSIGGRWGGDFNDDIHFDA